MRSFTLESSQNGIKYRRFSTTAQAKDSGITSTMASSHYRICDFTSITKKQIIIINCLIFS